MPLTTFTKASTRVTWTDNAGGGNSVNPANYNVEFFEEDSIIIRTANSPNEQPVWKGTYLEMSLASHGNVPNSQLSAWTILTTYFFI
jgi:hypothetical protein